MSTAATSRLYNLLFVLVPLYLRKNAKGLFKPHTLHIVTLAAFLPTILKLANNVMAT